MEGTEKTLKEIKELRHKSALLKAAAQILSVSDDQLPKTIARFLNEIKEMESRLV